MCAFALWPFPVRLDYIGFVRQSRENTLSAGMVKKPDTETHAFAIRRLAEIFCQSSSKRDLTEQDQF